MEEYEVTSNKVQSEFNKQAETLKEVKDNLKYCQILNYVRVVDELNAYGNNIFLPFFDYYYRQFMNLYGDIYRLQSYAIHAQIFDAFLLMGDSIEIIRQLTNELIHFGYDKYFIPYIISSFKNTSLNINLRHIENITLIMINIRWCYNC